MKRNTRIARQLLKIARELIAEKGVNAAAQEESYDILSQLEILKQYPRNQAGDTGVHDYVGKAFKALYTIKNGTFDGFEEWKARCRASVQEIVAKANESIAKTGQLGLTNEEMEKLRVALGFLSNEKFLVSITPGKIKGKNILQSGPGDSDDKGGWKIPTVPGPGKDKNTNTVVMNAPPQRLSGNSNWLLNIPQGIINLSSSVKEMVVSWGNRIIGGTEIGTINPDDKRVVDLKTSWTEISDDTLSELEMKLYVKLSKLPNHKFDEFIKCMKILADQLGQRISDESMAEFEKKQLDVLLAIEGFNKKIVGYATTYRDGISAAMSEYTAMVKSVNNQGGIVNQNGEIIMPDNNEENVTASVRRRNAGIVDAVKNLFKKFVDGTASLIDKILPFKKEAKEEMKNVSDKAMEWSMAGQEITQSFENECKAINDCVNALNALANEE